MAHDIGTLVVSRTNDNPAAVARLHTYGPRGGVMGSVLIDRDNGSEARDRLTALLGDAPVPAAIRDDLRAVLDYAQPSEEADAAREGEEGHIVLAMRRLRAVLNIEVTA